MLLILLLTLFFHKKIINNKIDFEKLLKIIALIAITLDPIYWIRQIIVLNSFNPSVDFPLYICSLYWVLIPFVAFSKKQGKIYRSALSCMITVVFFGGIFGMVFNPYLDDFFSFKTQLSLFYHTLMLLTVVLIWSTNYYQPQKIDKILFMIPMFILLIIDFILDKTYNYDYGYLNGGKNTVLENISTKTGNFLFIIIFYGLMFSAGRLIIETSIKLSSKNVSHLNQEK